MQIYDVTELFSYKNYVKMNAGRQQNSPVCFRGHFYCFFTELLCVFFSLIPLSKVRTEILNSISLLTAEWGWSDLNDCKNWLPFTFYNLPMLFALQIANFYLFIVNFLIKSYHKCPNQEATAKLTQKYEKNRLFTVRRLADDCQKFPLDRAHWLKQPSSFMSARNSTLCENELLVSMINFYLLLLRLLLSKEALHTYFCNVNERKRYRESEIWERKINFLCLRIFLRLF